MKGEILFLAHRLPFPPDRGDKIRSHHILRKLSELAPVHVATFAESEGDFAHEPRLAKVAESYCLVRRSKMLPLAGVEALFRSEPVSLAAFRDSRLADHVHQVLSERPVDTIFVFSGQMAQYVPKGWKGRVIADLVDVDSAKFEAYAARADGPLRWINQREGRLLRLEEESIADRADSVLFVSEAEAELFRSRVAPKLGRKVSTLRNGIDLEFFNAAAISRHPEIARSPGPHIVFTGQMDYRPNVDAALRVIERLLPRIRGAHPDAQFHVVGRSPDRQLLKRAGKDGCRVWGEVPDVRPFLAAADIVLVPLEIARGVQNKVLEAMAMARPVLLTEAAATGIGALDGTHFAIEDSDEGLVAKARELLADAEKRQKLGSAARSFVEAHLSWSGTLEPLERLTGREAANGERRDAA